MDVIGRIRQTVAPYQKTIVLPEITDERIIDAAVRVSQEGFARIVLPGDPAALERVVVAKGGDLDRIGFVDTADAALRGKLVQTLVERRKHKGLGVDEAHRLLEQPLHFGALMVAAGLADGMVAGSLTPSAQVIRACLHCVGVAEGLKTVSSCFLMILPGHEFGDEGVMLYADCGCVPNPTAEQLPDIAIAAATGFRQFTGGEPRIAMLSFSSKGSATHPLVDKMVEATRRLTERAPDLVVDGELQLDAAVIPEVAMRKAPGSPIKGRANILIFPDLNAGNICYKMTERFGGAVAVGPIMMGLAKPINDLSRGCDVDEIVGAIAVTAVQAIEA